MGELFAAGLGGEYVHGLDGKVLYRGAEGVVGVGGFQVWSEYCCTTTASDDDSPNLTTWVGCLWMGGLKAWHIGEYTTTVQE